MKREIKFRGKKVQMRGSMDTSEAGEFVFGSYVWDGYEHFIITDENIEWCVNPETVGQYTGQPDRNSKEIYEKAMVLITGTQELGGGLTFEWNEKAIVKWSDEECGFYLDAINKREVGLCQDGYFTVDTFPLRKWEEGEWDIEYEVLEGEI
ncbi:hypothetical protein H8Z60_23850 [Mycolicibacterium fortuitum]|nr:hypothetical protein [Mycolicibacterium fortuitum]